MSDAAALPTNNASASSAPPPALATMALGFRYGGGFALEGVSLTVEPGQFAVLLGPNGAGKSTLVCLLTRLFAPSWGDIWIGGRSLAATPGPALAGLGVVFQQTTLDLDLTVLQNLRYAASLHGLAGSAARGRIEVMLEKTGLDDLRGQPARRLSGGNRRKLEVARALLHRPTLLICDEATVGLDVPSRRALLTHIRQLCREEGLAVLWATHLLDEVAPGDAVTLIQRGRTQSLGRAAEVMARLGAADMESAFTALTTAQGPAALSGGRA